MRNSLIIVLLVLMVSCQPKSDHIVERSINEISNLDFVTSDVVLLDVRSAEEFEQGHLPNAKLLDVNSDTFELEIENLDPSKTYYVYCQAGVRSTKACEMMMAKGIRNIVNLHDGYKNYTPQ